MRDRQPSYGTTDKTFHWAIVALLAVQLPLGWLMPDIRRGITPGAAMLLHLSIGLLVLSLTALRIGWRLTHPVAPEPGLPRWQQAGAAAVHWLLYAIVLLTTFSGWFFASARGWTVRLFWAMPLPHLVARDSPLGRALGGWHAFLTWVLLIFIGLHVAAALVHRFVYKDRVLSRMLPG